MTDPDKKQSEDPFENLKGYLKDGFDRAKSQVGESLETISNEARSTLKTGEKAANQAFTAVQDTLGKDRLIGAVLGAKAGGTIGLAAGIPGMVKGGIVGAAVGFVGGRKFLDWYNKDKDNDNSDPKDNPPPPSP